MARKRSGTLPSVIAQRQPLDQRGLADAGIADVDRVVLAPPLEHVERALDLRLAADQRVDAAGAGERGQVLGEGGERVAAPRSGLAVLAVLAIARGERPPVARRGAGAAGRAELRDPVGEVADDVEPAHPLLVEELHGVALRLEEHRHQEVAAGDLGAAGAVRVGAGAGERALERERQPRLAAAGDAPQLVVEPGGEPLAQRFEVGAGVAQHEGGLLVEGQGVEQVLHAGVLVAEPRRLADRDAERDLEVLRQPHGAPSSRPPSSRPPSASRVSRSGIPSARAAAVTSATLVSATSFG